MIIGIDLDGVIIDTEILYRTEAELYDINELKQNSLVDKSEVLTSKRYKWNKKDLEKFYEMEKDFARNATLIPGAKKVIDMLKADGHKLILISARGNRDDEMKEIGIESLNKYDIHLDKYYIGVNDKLAICKKENVDVMIDDNYDNCKKLSKGKIFTLYFKDSGMKNIRDSKYLKTVYNFGEIYREINNLNINRK